MKLRFCIRCWLSPMHHFLNGFVCFPLLSVVIFSCPLIFSKEGNLIHGIMFFYEFGEWGDVGGGGVSLWSHWWAGLLVMYLQVWFCRIALMFKLQMFSTAEVELEAFGSFNQPDLFYEFYPDTYPGRKGMCLSDTFSWVSHVFQEVR